MAFCTWNGIKAQDIWFLLFPFKGRLAYIETYDILKPREGMGLLEYQAMPSMRDVAHDGWLCTFLYNSSSKFHQLSAWQPLSGQPVRYEKTGGTVCPSCTNHTCRGTLLQPARRAAVLYQPSSLRPHSKRPCCA
jgi:hypothetical protein